MDTKLPIADKRDDIIEAVRRNQVTIVAGETGSGKTTQVPQYLRASGIVPADGLIGITQPRRVAAIGVAMFVAEQTGCALGDEVGYQIRHVNETSARTRLKFMTDGILLRELLVDPLLERYDALILDEAHERNLNQDIIMALVKRLLHLRPHLKVVLMSATIDERRFARYLGAPIVRIDGRTHPVDIVYLGRDGNHVTDAVAAVGTALAETDGDVLVFMPDQRSIRRTVVGIEAAGHDVDVLPLFGDQSPDDQKRIFARSKRSVIVSTNIAETSITLDGVTAVVDTGLIKQMTRLHGSSISTLQVVPHSRAGCEQRAGRAGRTRPGVCYRLFDEREHAERPSFTEPEITRSSLEQVLLQLKAMRFGDDDIASLALMDRPPAAAWRDAKEQLRLLGAVDANGGLTADGSFMATMPLPPTVSRMILSARRYGCVRSVTTIAATFAARPVFVFPKGEEEAAREAHEIFRNPRSDFITALNAIEAWRRSADPAFADRHYLHGDALEEIVATETQILEILASEGIDIDARRSEHAIAKSVASGLIPNLLVRSRGGTYRGRKCEGVHVFPGSAVFGKGEHRFIAAADIVETNRVFARNVQTVREEWINEIVSLGPDDELLGRLVHGAKKRREKKNKKQRFRNRIRRR